MNLCSKSKKRVVLPSRPDPPTVDRILEDINRAAPNDPVFSVLEQIGQVCHLLTSSLPAARPSDSPRPADTEVELRFQQCCRYLELNEQLQETRGRLQLQREELQVVGEQLDRDVAKVKGQALD
ncbi:UPF0449 protein C19orf25 homolog isoform X1 [Embiotoca jacksoni]|uniref:UPF0449 protein C19orf25 homolog isoform X1 n=1 Tax=Embiotoca jacksoni TaxID=100190 RepID=UPI0037046D91